MKSILLTDEEIIRAIWEFNYSSTNWEMFKEAGLKGYEREIAKAQLEKMVEVLKDKTIRAWGGNRVILDEDWKAMLKEVE